MPCFLTEDATSDNLGRPVQWSALSAFCDLSRDLVIVAANTIAVVCFALALPEALS